MVMGSGASTDRSDFVSPRVQGLEGQQLTLDSPALLDLGHGTIRYRYSDEKTQEKNNKVKTGYFYHPRLDDYSEDAQISPEERFKLYYVFKGPKKDRKAKKLHYVYATSINAKDEGIKQKEYRPQGMGYDWPESYRKANNLYYDLTFLEQAEEEFGDSDSEASDVSTVSTTPRSTAPSAGKDNIRIVVSNSENVDSLKKRLAMRLLIPSSNFRIIHKKYELRDDDIVGDLRGPEDGTWRKFAKIDVTGMCSEIQKKLPHVGYGVPKGRQAHWLKWFGVDYDLDEALSLHLNLDVHSPLRKSSS